MTNATELTQDIYKAFDDANAQDPNHIEVDGNSQPKELIFAKRLTDEVLALDPDASLALRLAARCQHICRWEIPRDTQPMGRAGYLKWRQELKKFHAQKAGEILRELKTPEDLITQVQELNLKKNLKSDPDCQTLEDALCIVFLKYQFDDLIESTEEDKMIRIVQKTWAKMSEQGQQHALRIDFSPAATDILTKFLKAYCVGCVWGVAHAAGAAVAAADAVRG